MAQIKKSSPESVVSLGVNGVCDPFRSGSAKGVTAPFASPSHWGHRYVRGTDQDHLFGSLLLIQVVNLQIVKPS